MQTYHEWLQDEVIREATASEELSLEEEYEMQGEQSAWIGVRWSRR